eukprot:SAG22_NODE_704_length_7777_cov_6.153295_1_plen_60_part_00
MIYVDIIWFPPGFLTALASVTIPDSVTEIGRHAFLGFPSLPPDQVVALRARYGRRVFDV